MISEKMTNETAQFIINNSNSCVHATLKAFGYGGFKYPAFTNLIIYFLKNEGYTLVEFKEAKGRHMNRFKKFPEKDKNFLIFTHGHAMAMIDGILIDTARRGFDMRIIEGIWEVI